MSQVALYYQNGSSRGRSVTKTLTEGMARLGQGDKAQIYTEDAYTGPLAVDYVVFYGLSGNLMQLAEDYWKSNIPTVFFDLPYWGRKNEPYPQCHRFAINAYQPTAYFRKQRPADRFGVFDRKILPWQMGGEEILVIGMSEKQTQVWGMGGTHYFHTSMIDALRSYTDRPIAWRPKPSCRQSREIPGTRYATGKLSEELNRAYCVATYRSNVAIDGLLAGVPCVVVGDHPAEVMAQRSLADIEQPYYPDNRAQFCADLAYCQVSMEELRNGWAWQHIKQEIQEMTTGR